MGVTFELAGNAVIANIEGRLDSSNSAAIEAELVGRAKEAGLILDLSKLDYISSAGLRVILVLAKLLKQTGDTFVLAGLQPHIKDVFEISGFLSILDVAGSRNEALARV